MLAISIFLATINQLIGAIALACILWPMATQQM